MELKNLKKIKIFTKKNEFGDIVYDVKAEMDYFDYRMEAINNYNSSFFETNAKLTLIKRYLYFLAAIPDEIENYEIRQIAYDCLLRLGCDDYILQLEVDDLKLRLENLDEEERKNHNKR